MALTPGTSIWLYGSFARGDADQRSDIDILVVGQSDEWRDAARSDSELASLEQRGHLLSPMHFSWSEVNAMRAYGSLFMHHVKLEGRPIIPAANDLLGSLLEELPPYRRATAEMQAFTIVLEDVMTSVRGDHSPNFEMAVIATALRHAFILGCYVSGNADFGRTTPFHTLGQQLGLPAEAVAELETLYGFRLYQQGRGDLPFNATTNDVVSWAGKAVTLFQAIQERVDDFDRAMP